MAGTPAPSPNADLVRRAFERFAARDADALVELMDPEGAIYPYAIDERRHDGYRGHEGLRRYVADVDAMFESFDVHIDEIRDVGDDVVLADGRLHGTARDGTPIDMATSWLWTIRDGRVLRMQAHPAPPARAT